MALGKKTKKSSSQAKREEAIIKAASKLLLSRKSKFRHPIGSSDDELSVTEPDSDGTSEKGHGDGNEEEWDDDDNLHPPGYPVQDDGANQILGISNDLIVLKHAKRWLLNAEQGEYREKVMTKAPVRPKGGQIILFRCSKVGDTTFLKDQYQGFENNGGNSSSKSPVYKKYFYLYDVNGDLVSFKKYTLELKARRSRAKKFVIIHYLGDETLWQPRSHGNAKTDKPYTAVTDETLENIQNHLKVTGQKPKKAYGSLLRAAKKKDDFKDRELVDAPRDKIQVQNEKRKLDASRKLLRCSIFSIVEFSRNGTLGDFIHRLILVPYEFIVVAEPAVLTLGNVLLGEAMKNKKTTQLVTYDTTYKLGPAYVSTVVMRNTQMAGDPIFALVYLMHERRLGSVHKEFWAIVRKLVPNMKAVERNVPIATDREYALPNAIRHSFPDANIVFCSNHIKKDIERWIKKAGGKSDDLVVLCDDMRILMAQESEELLIEKCEERKINWSQEFKTYVETNLLPDIKRHAAWYYTRRFYAFHDMEATTNISEALHSLIKNHNDWQSHELDTLLMMLFNLQLYHIGEFDRAYRGAGNYVRKPAFKDSKPPVEIPDYTYWEQEEFIKFFKEGVDFPTENIEKEGNYLQGVTGLARAACERNKVSLDSRAALFHVAGLYNRKGAVVTRDVNGSLKCSCPSTGFCYHRLAVLQAVRMEVDEDKFTYNLSILSKKTRGFKPGKKGGVTRKEFMTNFNPPPDADIVAELDDLDLLISEEEGDSCEEPSSQVSAKAKEKTQVNNDAFNDQVICSDSDDVDEIGLHHYSFVTQASNVAVVDSQSVTSRRSLASEPTTPQEFIFGNVPEEAAKVVAKLLNTSSFSCLKPRKWVCEDVVNDMICFLIKIHGLVDNIAFVNSMEFRGMRELEHSHKTLSTAERCEGLNSDVVLINVLAHSHYVLAVILYRKREVIIIDSKLGHIFDLEELYQPIMRFVAATYVVAGVRFSCCDWKFIMENEIAEQTDGFDCAIFVCMNVYSIVRKERFHTTESFPHSEAVRRWIAYCLNSEKKLPVVLKSKQRGDNRVPMPERLRRRDELNSIEILPQPLLEASSANSIKEEIKTGSQSWDRCASVNCLGDHEGDREWLFCVVCRNWYFAGLCVPEPVVPKKYYFCPHCTESEKKPVDGEVLPTGGDEAVDAEQGD